MRKPRKLKPLSMCVTSVLVGERVSFNCVASTVAISAFPTADYYGTSATSIRYRVALTLPYLPKQMLGARWTLPTFTVFRW